MCSVLLDRFASNLITQRQPFAQGRPANTQFSRQRGLRLLVHQRAQDKIFFFIAYKLVDTQILAKKAEAD